MKAPYWYNLLFVLFFLFFISCNKDQPVREQLDLSGTWQFETDEQNTGIAQQWYLKDLKESIHLPSTMDQAGKGHTVVQVNPAHLNRIYQYEGPAWYRRKVTIPSSWQGKQVQLVLERTKSSQVWVDDHYAGSCSLLVAPHRFNVTPWLTPGQHVITLRIDNRLSLTPYGNVHMYSDDTQTNWNGLIGKLHLECMGNTYIKDIQVFPDIDNQKIRLKVSLANFPEATNLQIKMSLQKLLGQLKVNVMPVWKTVRADSVVWLTYDMKQHLHLWDDYKQPLFQLKVTILQEELNIDDTYAVDFGMRQFKSAGTKCTINVALFFYAGNRMLASFR
jgi:beta-galactosidase/beta-glucuronidase